MLLERLLPALLSAVAMSGGDADMRFSCLKVMSDLLALLLDLSADGAAPPWLAFASARRLSVKIFPQRCACIVDKTMVVSKKVPVCRLQRSEACMLCQTQNLQAL